MAQTDSIAAPADTLTRRDVRKEKMKHTGSLLKRFFKNFDEYDTDYITPNVVQGWTLRGLALDFRGLYLRSRSPEKRYEIHGAKSEPV